MRNGVQGHQRVGAIAFQVGRGLLAPVHELVLVSFAKGEDLPLSNDLGFSLNGNYIC